MLKLYKRNKAGIRYWEAWKVGGFVVVHEGKLGERGKTKHLFPEDGQTPEQAIEVAAGKSRTKGYEELPHDRLNQVVVQYRTEGWGSVADLERRHKVEGFFNECLGWTGNGHCDGGDIGSGTINIFNYVVDADLAAQEILTTLRKKGALKGAVITIRENEEYRVVYPVRFKGEFSL